MTTNNDINAPIPFALSQGGTAANLTASNGGIFYSTASAGAILAGTATANQILLSGSSTTPAWSTSTYPATNAINTILYASAANVMSALATANNGVLLTSGSGVPSIGNATVAVGGTGNTTFTAYSVICAGTTATGSFQNVSGLGSSGNVLTSNGAGALPTWQAAAGGSGELVFIASATASSSTTLDFDACFSSSYNQYFVTFTNLLPATNASNLLVQLGTGGTPTWVTSGYIWITNFSYSNGTQSGNGSSSDTSWTIGGGGTVPISNSSTYGGVNGHMWISGTNNASNVATINGQCSYETTNNSTYLVQQFSGNLPAATYTSLRIKESSGNLTSGIVAIYGLKTS